MAGRSKQAGTAVAIPYIFNGASIGRMELCVKGKVSQNLVCEIHEVIRRLVEDRAG